MKIAIAHDYLTQRGGAERVVLSMLKAFPEAELHTLLYEPRGTFPQFREARIRTSRLDAVPMLKHWHRATFPVLRQVSETMRIEADVVLASSSGWAHGFPTEGRVVVYCHNPARWLYQSDDYLGDAGPRSLSRLALGALGPSLTRWDGARAAHADRYLANSRAVRDRIASAYGRDAEVLHPPVSIDTAGPWVRPVAADWPDGSYHLAVSRLLPYKHVDQIVEAFRGLPDERLLVVGRGPQWSRLRESLPANVRMVRDLTDAELRWCYAHCRALVAASHEDYGLTPLEAAAFGKPAIALRGGGYLDTVEDGVTGILFDHPDAGSIREAVRAARDVGWCDLTLRAHSAEFDERSFVERLRKLVLD